MSATPAAVEERALTLFPLGHRQTELGVLPEDWTVRELGNLTEHVRSGITPTGGERVYKVDGRPFLRSQNVGWGNLQLDDLAFIDESTHGTFAATEIRNNDVLLNITGASIGRCAVADQRIVGGNVNQHVCEIRCTQERLNPHFLNSFLLSDWGQRQINSFQTGGSRQGLNFSQIRSFQVPYPQLAEQRLIATALSSVDGLIGALDKLIAKKRGIKLAVMQQLLTGEMRMQRLNDKALPNKKTDLGTIPGDWRIFKIREIARVKTGPFGSALHEKDYVDYGTPIITVEHLGEFGIGHTGVPMISAQDRNRLKAYVLQEGDIVFSRVGSVDRNALVRPAETGWLFSGRLLRIRLDQAIADPAFLSYYFHQESFKVRVRNISVGQTMPSLNTRLVRDIDVVLPGLPEQRAIASVLSDMDSEINALERRREKIKDIKRGMMQMLLTGRVRLVKPGARDE